MACFGKCNCGCCLGSSDLANIADTIKIDFPASDPLNRELVQSDCCWSANRPTGYTDYLYLTNLVQEYTANESVQISVKIIESQKIPLNTPATVSANGEGDCQLFFDDPMPSAESVCNEEVNCGTVLKEAEYIERVYAGIGYFIKDIKVSIHKELMVCEENGPTECKYIVECAVLFEVVEGGYLYISHTLNLTHTDEFQCCSRINCETEKLTHDEDFGDEPGNLDHWSYGAPGELWMVRYKVYDDIADIPDTITFLDSDINVCNTSTCQPATDSLCFFTEAEDINGTPGIVQSVPLLYTCLYCIDFEMICFPSLDDYPCGRGFPPPFPCDCDPNALTRFDANNLSQLGQTFGGFSTSYNTLLSTALQLFDGSPCHVLPNPDFYTPLDCIGTNLNPGQCYDANLETGQNAYPGVDVADRTICNWWDCQDCYFTGHDPAVPPYQYKMHNIDSYSFSDNWNPYPQDPNICIPFPAITVRLNR